MHVHCSGEQTSIFYAFSVDIGTLLLLKCVYRGSSIIKQNFIIENLKEDGFGDVVYRVRQIYGNGISF